LYFSFFFLAEQAEDEYKTLRNYESLRGIAVTYVEQALTYKIDGELSTNIKQSLASDYGITDKNLQDTIIRNILLHPRVDTKEIPGEFGTYHFT
jgi:hypothetical protein